MLNKMVDEFKRMLNGFGLPYDDKNVEDICTKMASEKADLISLMSKSDKWSDDTLSVVWSDVEYTPTGNYYVICQKLGKMIDNIIGRNFYCFEDNLSWYANADCLLQNEISRDIARRVNMPSGTSFDDMFKGLMQKYGYSESDISTKMEEVNKILHPGTVRVDVVWSVNPYDFLHIMDGATYASDSKMIRGNRNGVSTYLSAQKLLRHMYNKATSVMYVADKNSGVKYDSCFVYYNAENASFGFTGGFGNFSFINTNFFRSFIRKEVSSIAGVKNKWVVRSDSHQYFCDFDYDTKVISNIEMLRKLSNVTEDDTEVDEDGTYTRSALLSTQSIYSLSLIGDAVNASMSYFYDQLHDFARQHEELDFRFIKDLYSEQSVPELKRRMSEVK